jgi:hypothetical protein
VKIIVGDHMRLILFFFFLVVSILTAAEKDNTGILKNTNPTAVNFNFEKFNLMQQAKNDLNDDMVQQHSKKSGIKAALMSAAIPGLGEVYAKSYWRAAVFFALDVALLSTNFVYEDKGNDEDKRMKVFGNEHWIERQYWSKLYYEADQLAKTNPSLAERLPDYSYDESDPYHLLQDYENVNVNSLRFLEQELEYTHTLPSTKTQQYYEMIYKYLHQFGAGWDDLPYPDFYDNLDNLGTVTPNIKKYRTMRNRSNDYYQTATTMLNLMLLNHVLSAFDAALAVKQFNKKINYAVRVNSQFDGFDRVTTYGLCVSW